MTLRVEQFFKAEPSSQEYHAVEKALKENPRVVLIGEVDGVKYFEVKSTRALGTRYVVRMWEDDDRTHKKFHGISYVSTNGQFWIECSCAAAYPAVHPFTNIIAWLPKCCYHSAAVLVHQSKNTS